ncbi:MAG TPA: Hpt domain-containing protein, partial [Polyangiaceae bacterium]
MIDLSKFNQGFFEEAREHASAMERDLLLLEQQPGDSEILNQVFRAAHSIKGAAGTLGFTNVSDFTHAAETLLDLMRHGSLPVTHARITVLLQATDEIRGLIRDCESGRAESTGSPKILAHMLELSEAGTTTDSEQHKHPATATPTSRDVRIAMVPASNFFASGLDPILLFRDLQRLGTVKHVACDTTHVPELAELDPELCYVSWTVLLHTTANEAALRETFLFVEDICRITIASEEQQAEQLRIEPPTGARTREVESSTLRVTAEKVDAIIDLVGELVIAQSMVMQMVNNSSKNKSPLLRDALDSMSRNMQELQERVMGIRMVPIGTLFGRFSRMVRDTAAELGKTVQLRVEGQETEIDKAVVERLVDPLTHLMRNALDHGIETDEERRRLGKTEPAEVNLLAQHVAGGIVIQVRENGRGLDTAKIRAK